FSADTPLVILGAEIQDEQGSWHPILPLSFQERRRTGIAEAEFQPTSGRPIEYEKRENELILRPAPDNGVTVTLTAGLKLFYLRTADVYTSQEVSTGTKVPGFPSPWHDIIAYEVAYHYAIANGLPNANQLFQEFNRKEQAMLDFISRRNQDERHIMRPKRIRYI
ncbi:hypothetical protein LCGC14_2810310, partial [marine sediment metagenome]